MARMYSIKKSGQHADIDYVVHNKNIIDKAINIMHSTKNHDYTADFYGFSDEEVEEKRDYLIRENDRTHSLLLLTAIEALIRLDADSKYQQKKRDPLSRLIRDIYNEKNGTRIKLEEDLINARINEDKKALRSYYSELKRCFKYRHWLAHGRYWSPQRINIVDFNSILILIQLIMSTTEYPYEI